MITTRDPGKAARLRLLRNHGAEPKYYHREIGGNFRLDALQAAVVRVKLRHLDAWTDARQRNACSYDALFAEAGLVGSPLQLPPHPPCGTECSCRHVFNQYTIRVPDRDALKVHLHQHGIGHEVYYPVPLHLQDCFAHLGHSEGAFPESERAAREVISLPVYPELTESQRQEVVETIRAFYQG